MTNDNPLLSFLQHDQRLRLKIMRMANQVKMAMDEKDGEKTEKEFNKLYKNLKLYVDTHEDGLTELEEAMK